MLSTETLLSCDTRLSQQQESTSNSAPPTFKFPPPPSLIKTFLPLPAPPTTTLSSPAYVMSTSDVESNSDTSADDYATASGRSKISKVATKVPVATSLPPIGVFWDIENCQIPRGRSALSVAQTIRDNFFDGYREVEFVVVCDVKKENAQIIQELNDAQVNLIHVSSTCKNAADAKLRQSIRRFADIHAAPAAIILISGDVNFAADLSDLRHRKKMHVILLHNDRCSDSLILCASEHHDYTALVSNLPLRGTTCKITASGPAEVLVTGLPPGMDHSRIRNRLKRLSENCGGRVGIITDYATTIRFPNYEFASRCQKRIDSEHVFGSKIHVGPPVLVQPSPGRNYPTTHTGFGQQQQQRSQRRHYNSEGEHGGEYGGGQYSGGGGGYNSNQENIQDPTPGFQLWHSQNNKSSFQNYHRSSSNNGGGNGNGGTTAMNGGRPVLGNSNGNAGHYCKSGGQQQQQSSSQPITILKRTSPLPPNFLFNLNTSIPPPPLVNVPPQSNSSGGTNAANCSSSVANSSIPNERYFHPISSSSSNPPPSSSSSYPVELHVTNLDQSVEPSEMKRILGACFTEHVTSGPVHVSVFTQSDGTQAAAVKLRSAQDAQVAISQLHRKKIGFKRISISYSNSGVPNHSPALIRSQIISLLQEVPKYKLPLFKFREMFEMRYSTSISVSELYKMKDVCTISDESNGRIIALNPDQRENTTPSPINRQTNSTPLLEQPYCTLHFKLSHQNSSATLSSCAEDKGWAELEASTLPSVKLPLSEFAVRVTNLIELHAGALPLLSFPDCYEAQFGSLCPDESGVPLEHLVTCIRGVELVLNSYAGIKYLRKVDPSVMQAAGNSGPHASMLDDGNASCNETSPSVSPSLQGQMTLLCRELVDLLKTFPHCTMVFNKFIPAYHHHFGRQCRVADYGFTKLIDLLEAIPHVVQVMGEGSRRLITLSHRAQMRRFTSDLLRCLKSVPNKQCLMSAFPAVFARVHARPFDPVDYGLSSLSDLLANVSENTIVICPATTSTTCNGGVDEAAAGSENVPQEGDVMIAVPKREQTSDEIERTKKFSREVVEVLSHMPHYSILFNKFIPSYHHHYGHQCRVADFGFTKLIELFESIPEVVTIEDDVEDRRITLTTKEKLNVLLEQTKSLITLRSPITLDNLNASFSWQFGYPLRPVCYGCDSLDELVKKLESNIKVQDRKLIIAEDNLLSLKLFRIFLENSPRANPRIPLSDFINIYRKLYKVNIRVEELTGLSDVVTVVPKGGVDYVTLTPLQLFAKDIYHLLYACEGKMSLTSVESMYLKMFGTAVQCAVYGHQSLSSLLGSIASVVTIKGKHKQKILILNRSLSLVGISLPRENNNSSLVEHNNNKTGYYDMQHRGRKLTNSGPEYNGYKNGDYNGYKNGDNAFKSYKNGGAASNSNGCDSFYDTNSRRYSNPPHSSFADDSQNAAASNGVAAGQQGPVVHLPDFKIHPDTFTCTPLTSPYKGLPTAPHPSELPLPPFQINF
uniref:Meiosis arrest female protein 1 n=1 Tax=Cacopsylla melanoneura TaxID=428564 RepID=A0A8D8QAS1_9HEMI